MLDPTYREISIPAGTKSSFTITAKTLGGSGRASVDTKTEWQNSSYTQTAELPVRSAWPSITSAASATFEPGNTPLNVPLDDFTGDISGTLTLADTPAVNVNNAVNFLNTYPYACLEQTISGAWPFLILPDALAELDPLTVNDDAIRERTEGALTRIQSMQLYDGSFSAWPGRSATYSWGSVYAAHFLLSAKNAGIPFPDEMLSGVMNWLRNFLASMPANDYPESERDDMTTKAYAVYVLALNGEKPLGWIEYLRENMNLLRSSGHIYLAGAQSLTAGNADALRSLTMGSAGYSGATLESDTRNTAILLSMWLDVEPQAPEVTELAVRLVDFGNNGEWYSTQDNAWALVALARYNVEVSGGKSNLTAHVNTETSDKALLTFTSGRSASMNVADLPKNEHVLIEASGEGRGYYAWSITGFPKRAPKAERRNVNIECVYYDEKGNVLNMSQPINHGSIIQVVLHIKPSMTVNSLAVNYLLPSGFEIENPRLDDGVRDNSGYGVMSDIRDDRLVLFFDRLSSERSYGFRMRAVTRGKFKVPQISAYGMYDAGIRFVGQVQPDVEIK